MTFVAGGPVVPEPEPDGPEKRQEARPMAIYREATLEAGPRAGLCVVKNLSSGGAMIQTIMALPIDEPVALVMTSGRRAAGRIRWRQSDLSGIAFDTATSPSWLLDRDAGLVEPGPCRRLPRVAVSVPAAVVDRDGPVDAVTCDLSRHGMRLASERALVIGPVTIDVDGLGSIPARALWNTNGQSGCLLDRPLSVDDVTEWLGEREATA